MMRTNALLASSAFTFSFLSTVVLFGVLPISNAELSTEQPCDLRCWLSDLEIYVPDLQFEFSWLLHDYSGNITDIHCQGISVGPVFSLLDSPSQSLSTSLTQLSTSCFTTWSVLDSHGKTKELLVGSGMASLFNTSFEMSLEVLMNSNGLPNAANLTSCLTTLFLEVNLTGGDAAAKLNAIFNQTMPQIEAALDQGICTAMTTLINYNITTIISTVADELDPYLSLFLPPELPDPTPEPLNLTTRLVWVCQIFPHLKQFLYKHDRLCA